jgi:hypothetical protein
MDHCHKRRNPSLQPTTAKPCSATAESHRLGRSLNTRWYETTRSLRDTNEMPPAITHVGIASPTGWFPREQRNRAGSHQVWRDQTHANGWGRLSCSIRHRPSCGTARRIRDYETPMRCRQPSLASSPPGSRAGSRQSSPSRSRCQVDRDADHIDGRKAAVSRYASSPTVRNLEMNTGPRDASEMPLAITGLGTAWFGGLVPVKTGETGLAAGYVETLTHVDRRTLLSHAMRYRPLRETARRIQDYETPMRRRRSRRGRAIAIQSGQKRSRATQVKCLTASTRALRPLPLNAHASRPLPPRAGEVY